MEKLPAKSWICLLVLLTDCITPFVPPTTLTFPRLVANGVITDQPGPYVIKIATTPRASTSYQVDYPSNAHVFIRDDQGNEEELYETKAGNFETSPGGIRGIVGRTYTLIVTLEDGTRYESNPELLKAVPPIGNIVANYKELPFGSQIVGKFETYVETVDAGTPGDYYRWTWQHYSERPLCFRIVTVRAPCCDRCWDIEQCESCITVATDKLTNGKKMSQFLLDIPYDSKSPYYLAVQQSSLSEEAYKFWKSVDAQVNNVGGVFDPPPAGVRGNLFNVRNKEEQVLGYFGASALSTSIVYVQRDNIEKPPLRLLAEYTVLQFCIECDQGYFRTKKKPDGWID